MQKKAVVFGIILVILLVTFVTSAQEIGTQAVPANPNLNSTARTILNYLHQLPNGSQNRVISGQFGAYGSGENYSRAVESLQRVFTKTGQYPGVTGMDCMMEDGMTEVVRYLTDMWNQGYLVNLSCHFRNPWTGGHASDWQDTSTSDPWDRRNVRQLITPGAPGNAAWMSTLDQLATHLQTLQSRGVVVFWRPLHENNGGWFWWGEQPPADYIALWQHMFNYFTNVKGLNNLLWVYSPNAADEWTISYLRNMYPGANYVDVVSLDKYMSVGEDPLQINSQGEYDFLVSTGKPFGLFEFGPIPASGEGWDINPYPYRMDYLIRDIRTRYPRTVLFQAWEYIWQLGSDNYRGLPELMNDTWVIARHELPNFRAGTLPTPTPPPATATPRPNLINNGSFAAGMNGWLTFGQITTRLNSGTAEFYRPTGSAEGVIFQNTGRAFSANTFLEARLDLGNSSRVRKRVTVLLHERDFSDLQACTFWLPPNTPLRTHIIRTWTTRAWTAAHLSVYASTADNTGWAQLDNVSVTQMSSGAASQTHCATPLLNSPLSGSDSPNRIQNGAFSTNALTPWFGFGAITTRVLNGVVEFYGRPGTSNGVISQNTGAAIVNNAPVEVTLDMANVSNRRKRIAVLVHDRDFSDLMLCSFWLEPNTPLGRYVVRGLTTEAWSNASLSIYASTADNVGWLRMDNVTLRHRPSLSTIQGTQCYKPGSTVAEESLLELGQAESVLMPTLEPTATPTAALIEPPLLATSEPLVAQEAVQSEGLIIEGESSGGE